MQLPHRFRETAFRKYEHIISSAVDAFPATITIDPAIVSVTGVTFACRCRDAMTSLKEHHWSTHIDMDKFLDIASRIVVSERTDGKIIIGSREGIAATLNVTSTGNTVATISPIQPSEKTFTLSTPEQKELVMLLAHERLIAPRLFLTGITDAEALDFQQRYDISLDKHSSNVYILI